MSSRISFAALALITSLLCAPAFATEGKAVPEGKDAAMDQSQQESGNPYLPKLEAKSKQIGAKLDKFALAHLYTVREGYGMISAVEIVRRDVGEAVKACGKANPDMKDDMTARFTSWTDKVDPVIKDKKDAIDGAIQQQTYLPAKEIQDYLKLIKQTADYANRKIDKTIITTPEACESLENSMDDTEGVVSKLLGEMAMLPWPPESEKP